MPFEFINQSIQDVVLIIPKVYKDNRGYFMENYKKSDFDAHGISDNFLQDNFSRSHKNVLRGLHYQIKPYEQAKLVRCTRGAIIDVAVDVRPNSKTFMQYIKVELNENNNKILYIPKGFAHGFVTISDIAEIHYKSSNEYSKNHERGIIWNDKVLNIDWNIDFVPILSEKDKSLPALNEIKEII